MESWPDGQAPALKIQWVSLSSHLSSGLAEFLDPGYHPAGRVVVLMSLCFA